MGDGLLRMRGNQRLDLDSRTSAMRDAGQSCSLPDDLHCRLGHWKRATRFSSSSSDLSVSRRSK